MSGLKGGALLLLLGIPFALYAAWQANGAAHIDTGAVEPPTDKIAPTEQLAAARAKTAALSGESRKAVEVTWQYRTAAPADNSPDSTVAAVVKAASARSADLTDLDRFLSSVKEPTFNGNPRLKKRYTEWAGELAVRETDAQKVAKWLSEPLMIASVVDADRAMDKGTELINDYSTRSQFADKGKAADWRIRGRLAVIDALAALADAQYQTAARVTLPLKEGANEGTTAVATLRGLKAHLAALRAELATADRDKVVLDPEVRARADAKGGDADEYAAREELLALFARADLFTNATGAVPWLKLVAEQYAKTKNKKVQTLIREKVQEFADAFVPLAARLDDKVLVKGKEVSREGVKIKFQNTAGGKVMSEPLSDALDGTNEFNFREKYPGDTTFVVSDSSELFPSALKPTALSRAAVAFNAARAKLTARTTGPRWTAESVEQLAGELFGTVTLKEFFAAKSAAELKNKCEAQKELVDQLRTLKTGTVEKIATRVAGLVAGVAACKELFEVGP